MCETLRSAPEASLAPKYQLQPRYVCIICRARVEKRASPEITYAKANIATALPCRRTSEYVEVVGSGSERCAVAVLRIALAISALLVAACARSVLASLAENDTCGCVAAASGAAARARIKSTRLLSMVAAATGGSLLEAPAAAHRRRLDPC